MSNYDLIEHARVAIQDVFSDTSVGPEDTLEALVTLREEVQDCISSIEGDLW